MTSIEARSTTTRNTTSPYSRHSVVTLRNYPWSTMPSSPRSQNSKNSQLYLAIDLQFNYRMISLLLVRRLTAARIDWTISLRYIFYAQSYHSFQQINKATILNLRSTVYPMSSLIMILISLVLLTRHPVLLFLFRRS